MFLRDNCLRDSISLNKVNINSIEEENQSVKDKSIIFCNLITTSMSPNDGDVLRINLKLCYVNEEGKFTKIRKTISLFEDPKRELSEEESEFLDFPIEKITGKTIDWKLVSNLFDQADLIVSHNSRFVKPWVNKFVGEKDDVWSCTLEDIDWNNMGFPSRSLEAISVFSGHFYNFSSSIESLDSLLVSLNKNNCLGYFLKSSFLPDLQIYAANAPIEYKDLLKERKYRWNPELKCWWAQTKNREEANKETQWLTENIPSVEPQIFEIDSKFRFV